MVNIDINPSTSIQNFGYLNGFMSPIRTNSSYGMPDMVLNNAINKNNAHALPCTFSFVTIPR